MPSIPCWMKAELYQLGIINMPRVLIILISFFFSSVVFAQPVAGWTNTSTVVGLFEVNENQMLVRFADYNNLGECGVDGGPVANIGHVIFDPTTQKAKLALLLTAFASGVDVKAWGQAVCTQVWAGASYGSLDHIQLIK